MTGITEEAICARAYELWQIAGGPRGDMDRFWYQAERELLASPMTNGQDRRPLSQGVDRANDGQHFTLWYYSNHSQ